MSKQIFINSIKRLKKEAEIYEQEIINTTKLIDNAKIDGNSTNLEYLKNKVEETNSALDDVKQKIFEFEEKLKNL